MKKNILVVCQYYYPENFQITPICEQLVKDGYGVTVLTGLPNYPSGIIPEEYKNAHRDEVVNGVHVIRCWEIPRRKGALGLGLNYISYVISASIKVFFLNEPFDYVLVYQLSPVTMGIPAVLYARKHHLPILLYCCDIWPESVKLYIQDEKHPVYRLANWISKKVYGKCDKILLQSDCFADYLEKVHGIPKEKMTHLPAFSNEAYLDENFNKPHDDINFVFLGNLGIAQNLISVLEAIYKIRHIDGFVVHFVGDGSCLGDMQDYVKDHHLENIVKFHGRRPPEEMPTFYKLADACLISLTNTSAIGLTLPSKVQGYMAAGKPILGMIDGDTEKVVKEAGCGKCVAAGDVNAFSDLLEDFIIHPENYVHCGENGRKYFKQHFRQSVFMARLEEELEAVRDSGNV